MADPYGPRYDFAPLWEAANPPSFLELARRLGVYPRQLYRWAHYGIPDYLADRLAISLGFVPYAIWPEWLHNHGSEVRDWVAETSAKRARQRQEEQERRRDALATLQEAGVIKPRVCEHCQWGFVPRDAGQRFCRTRCAEESRSRV